VGTKIALTDILKRSVTGVLEALVRVLLRHQITYPVAIHWLKSAYVRIAEREFQIAGKRQTDSRITLLTGVHRKEVRRIRSEPQETATAPKNIWLGATLIALWSADPRYQDKSGNPKPLLRRGGTEEAPSFEMLVREHNKDIRPRSVLDEWLRLGICYIDTNNLIHLDQAAFIPDAGIEEKLFYFERNIRDHINTCAHNIADPDNSFIERSVYYDHLTEADVLELQAYTREIGMNALLQINRKAHELQKCSTAKGGAHFRMTFGVYYYAEDESCQTRDEAPHDHEDPV